MLKLVDYLLVQVDKPWYNYYLNEPLYKDQKRTQIVVFVGRWSLFMGALIIFFILVAVEDLKWSWTGGLYSQVVFRRGSTAELRNENRQCLSNLVHSCKTELKQKT